MPYRIDISNVPDGFTVERLIDLGALDVDVSSSRTVAALMPDAVRADDVANALGVEHFSVSPAFGRDADSIWLLRPRPIKIGRLTIVPSDVVAEPGSVRLIDGPAFGTGLHPTTMQCVQILDEITGIDTPGSALDVGTGSGVLALAALRLGVQRAIGTDVDAVALRVAAENVRLNGFDTRLELLCSGPEAVAGSWPLVLANILAAPLIELAPALVPRVGHAGRLVLSGIRASAVDEVVTVYRDLGMRPTDTRSRDGWSAVILSAPW